ncbi:MAG: 4-alpha-glucanotransferase [Thermodesulfovibrionaceae bacterium]
MKNYNQLICRLSDLVGIIPSYINCFGQKIEIPLETKVKILNLMGFNTEKEELKKNIEYFETYPWLNVLEPVYVTEESSIFIYLSEYEDNFKIDIYPFEELSTTAETLSIRGNLKNCLKIEKKLVKNRYLIKYKLIFPKLPIGYYKLRLQLKNLQKECFLIICPKRCFTKKIRKWGVHLNLWSLRGFEREGDFSHLLKAAKWIKNHDGFISINPLHFRNPLFDGASPYSATSRIFNIPLFVSTCPVTEKNQAFFEYDYIWQQKMKLLKSKFEECIKKKNKEWKRFLKYKETLPLVLQKELKYFSLFCFLREKLGPDWRAWHRDFRFPEEEKLEKIYEENRKEILFYEYLQWLTNKDIKKVSSLLCIDISFGSTKSSYDVWINQNLYALDAEYGAPPDEFNPKGQKWGFPPIIPFELKNQGYLQFIKTLRANMTTEMVRVDHALGLFRAFWIPDNFLPCQGAYVKQPWQDLLKILCLESKINRTEVIAEDLGTSEDWMKEELTKRGMYSWKVFYFEKEGENMKSYRAYPKNALCSITTHDLPTLKGFWIGKDIELRKRFSIFDENQTEKAFKERQRQKENIIKVLKEENLILSEEENLEELLFAIIKFLSLTKCKYILFYLEDLLLLEDQQNLPGTTTEYPNWQIKLPVEIEEILRSGPFKRLIFILKETARLRN